ncbi:hypothetical protein FXO38_27589 [Capsicum annuum]|uniref:Uncharacterized protein n=1 Tax=Capsicum annuum TaxID=4072 RepID=A0A2G3A117_CAPAN|nr:hypothetical protein FXO38_27589 [Capsicum annuum]PHT87900.1 hypothetical protein T459_10006 [Capsicum annuum]
MLPNSIVVHVLFNIFVVAEGVGCRAPVLGTQLPPPLLHSPTVVVPTAAAVHGNWREKEDIFVISGETLLSFPMEARLEDNPAPREGTILVSTLLERDIEFSLPVVSGKKCLQKYVHQLFDEMPVKEKNGINSSSSKENSARMMEQVIDPECIASVAINFIEERRYPTYEPQLKVIGGDFDLLNISTDGDVNGFELSYVISNMKNSHDADLIIKSDKEICLNKVGDDDEMVIQENLSSIETFGFGTDLLVNSEDCSLKTLIIDVNTVAYNKGNFPMKLNVGSDVHGIERNIASKGEIKNLHNLSDKMLTCELQGSFDNLTHVSDILMETNKSWNDNTYLVEKVKNQIVDIRMESLMVDHKLSSPWSLDQPSAMYCTSIVCGYSHIRNAAKISVEGHIGLLILHFRDKSYTIRNALVGELEKLVVKDFNDMEVAISSKSI